MSLPPEIWAQIYSSVVDYANSYSELKPCLFICKLSYVSIYPRLFETFAISMIYPLQFDKWRIACLIAPDPDSLLDSRVKRVFFYDWNELRLAVPVSTVIAILDRYSSSIERIAYFPTVQTSHTSLFMATAVASLRNLKVLEVPMPFLADVLRESKKSPSSLASLDTLSLTWESISTTEVFDLRSFDFNLLKQIKSLKRIFVGTTVEDPPLATLLSQIPVHISPIIVSFIGDWQWEDSDPRFWHPVLFLNDPRIPWKAFRERSCGVKTDLLDDWGEITTSQDLLMWSYALKAQGTLKKNDLYAVFRRDSTSKTDT